MVDHPSGHAFQLRRYAKPNIMGFAFETIWIKSNDSFLSTKISNYTDNPLNGSQNAAVCGRTIELAFIDVIHLTSIYHLCRYQSTVLGPKCFGNSNNHKRSRERVSAFEEEFPTCHNCDNSIELTRPLLCWLDGFFIHTTTRLDTIGFDRIGRCEISSIVATHSNWFDLLVVVVREARFLLFLVGSHDASMVRYVIPTWIPGVLTRGALRSLLPPQQRQRHNLFHYYYYDAFASGLFWFWTRRSLSCDCDAGA